MPRNFDAEPKTEDEWAAFVKMKAATLSLCTQQVLKDIMDKRGWHADASDSKETLIDKLTTHLVADAKLKEQASLEELVLLQDNFSASLESPEDQYVKASTAAALQSEAVNRGNTSKRGKYLSVEHTLHAWRSSIAFLQATSMLYALHGGEAERGHVGDSKPCLKDDWGSGLFISVKHSVDAKASRVFFRLQSGGNLELHFVGELRAAPHGQYAPAGSRRDCLLAVSPTVGMLVPLSGNWVPAWSIRVLEPLTRIRRMRRRRV